MKNLVDRIREAWEETKHSEINFMSHNFGKEEIFKLLDALEIYEKVLEEFKDYGDTNNTTLVGRSISVCVRETQDQVQELLKIEESND